MQQEVCVSITYCLTSLWALFLSSFLMVDILLQKLQKFYFLTVVC